MPGPEGPRGGVWPGAEAEVAVWGGAEDVASERRTFRMLGFASEYAATEVYRPMIDEVDLLRVGEERRDKE